MDELLQQTLESVTAEVDQGSTGAANGMVFLLVAALGLLMALVYIPIRLYLTITARGRRLRLLQRIRKLREDLGQPVVSE